MFVTVSDENGVEFKGILLEDAPRAGDDDKVHVFVLAYGENGFGLEGPGVRELKHLGNGKYGA